MTIHHSHARTVDLPGCEPVDVELDGAIDVDTPTASATGTLEPPCGWRCAGGGGGAGAGVPGGDGLNRGQSGAHGRPV